uniref:Retinal rod rhodopsin-sensitive cGMP 3',5'-cyclic phosphodiesterase subunit delta n=1 Tax=Tetraselmis sp. GSL018 TaxID=582737 RepID=A0A061QX43_9CHLO
MATKFKIQSLRFSDAETGETLWSADKWPAVAEDEIKVEIPARILKCDAVAREVKFSSEEQLDDLRMEQTVFQDAGGGSLIKMEEWKFRFGFVIPHSHNSWQSTTLAAGDGKMVDPEAASGRVIIATRFRDGNRTISEMRVRVFYV